MEVLVTTGTIPVEGNLRITYTYTPSGQLDHVTAYKSDGNGGEAIVSQSDFDYNARQDLIFERQQLDSVANSASPQIDYQWTYASADAGNFDRLTGMTYPAKINYGRRQVSLGYASGADSALSRITSISSTPASTSYTYGGMSRRLSLALACGIAQTFAAAGGTVGATGLDRFGRVADLDYIGTSAPLPGESAGTVHRYEYRYDASGNRTHARVVQANPNWNGAGGNGDNRSWVYGYDALQRLTGADQGTATSGGDPGDPIPLTTTDLAIGWNLDNLGNWTGFTEPGSPPTEIPGMTITHDPDGTPSTDSRSQIVFFDNSLDAIKTQHGTASPVESAYVVNLVGSTVFDDVYYYEYDAWNRLIRVSDKGTVSAASFDSKGVLLPPEPDPGETGPDLNVPGDWRVQYVYDGLGRLARKETPVVAGGGDVRREDYRYDGVRRIQEVIGRQISSTYYASSAPEEGSGAVMPGEGETGEVTVAGLEEPVEATSLEPFDGGMLLAALPAEWDQREYVWGPDYVDELAIEFDRYGQPRYPLLDANYNVMAIVAGNTRPCGNIDADPYDDSVPAGTVLEQYVWSPYGELLAKDTLIPPATGESPRNRVGHQGLIFERFDGSNTDPPLVATDPITGEGKGWYYNRNRWYDATLGRFTTADPNGTAGGAQKQLANLGTKWLVISADQPEIDDLYSETQSRFALLASNPLSNRDPTGLFGLVEMGAVAAWTNDENLDTLDRGLTFFGALEGLSGIITERALEIENLSDALAEDGALFDFLLGEAEAAQADRGRALRKGVLSAGASWLMEMIGGNDLSDVSAWAAAEMESLFSTVGLPGPASLPGSNGATDYGVYVLRKFPNGPVIYAGMSHRQQTRTSHWARKGFVVDWVVPTGLTKAEARSMEQGLISTFGGSKGGRLLNKINSIASKHPWYKIAKAWGRRRVSGFR